MTTSYCSKCHKLLENEPWVSYRFGEKCFTFYYTYLSINNKEDEILKNEVFSSLVVQEDFKKFHNRIKKKISNPVHKATLVSFYATTENQLKIKKIESINEFLGEYLKEMSEIEIAFKTRESVNI